MSYLTKTDHAALDDLTSYGGDGLLERLKRLREQMAHEHDERVLAFIGLGIESVLAEMDRRVEMRIDRKMQERAK